MNKLKLDALNEFQKRQIQEKVFDSNKKKKVPMWAYPYNVERTYRKKLKDMVKAWKDAAKDTILARLPSIVNEAGFNQPKLDSYSEDIDFYMKVYLTQFPSRLSAPFRCF